jgi:hypothetical protein
LIALSAMLLLLAWLPRRRLDPRVVPAAAAGLLLIGSVGPLALRSLTVHSQAKRLIAVLDASGELKDGRFDGERTTLWGEETRGDLLSIVRLLHRHKALHLIAPVIGQNYSSNVEAITARLGLNQTGRTQPEPSVRAYARIDDIILTDAFGWRSDTNSGRQLLFRAPGHPEYALKVEDRSIVLSGPHGTATFDLTAEPELPLRSGATSLRLVNADRTRAVLILRELRWKGAGESPKLHEVFATILLR